jgi:hypothetical protein
VTAGFLDSSIQDASEACERPGLGDAGLLGELAHEVEQRRRLMLAADDTDRSREDDERRLDRDPVSEAEVAGVTRRPSPRGTR